MELQNIRFSPRHVVWNAMRPQVKGHIIQKFFFNATSITRAWSRLGIPRHILPEVESLSRRLERKAL